MASELSQEERDAEFHDIGYYEVENLEDLQHYIDLRVEKAVTDISESAHAPTQEDYERFLTIRSIESRLGWIQFILAGLLIVGALYVVEQLVY